MFKFHDLILAFLLTAAYFNAAVALEVYDCEGKDTTFETIDLTETAECPERESHYQAPTTRSIQILHNDQAKRISGVQCQVIKSVKRLTVHECH